MLNGWQLHKTLNTLRSGGVIAYPTEAVWGLGCDPFDQAAVERILEIKQRPMHKGLILVAGDMAQIDFLLRPLSDDQRATLARHWPGPVTFLIPDLLDQIPVWVKGKHRSVAVRISEHPLIRQVSEGFGGPVVSTSANPAGRTPARDRLQVNLYFNGEVDTITAGQLGEQSQPSRIIDLCSGKVLRG